MDRDSMVETAESAVLSFLQIIAEVHFSIFGQFFQMDTPPF
jgi:hypothetical protein